MALTNILLTILRLEIPKEVSMMVPPIGVRIRGVRVAMPQTPNLCHTLMMFLVLLVKTFCFFRILVTHLLLIHSPRNVNIKTEVIIPDTVTSSISRRLYPAA